MKRIAVVVEGVSDAIFWDRILHRYFRATRFKLINLKGRTKLISSAQDLVDGYKSSAYDALFLLLDADEIGCVSEVRRLFEDSICNAVQRPRDNRWIFLAVAFRELESWFMADAIALAQSLQIDPDQVASPAQGGKAALTRLLREKCGLHFGYTEREFAQRISSHFDPERARKCSISFDYFWTAIEMVVQR